MSAISFRSPNEVSGELEDFRSWESDFEDMSSTATVIIESSLGIRVHHLVRLSTLMLEFVIDASVRDALPAPFLF